MGCLKPRHRFWFDFLNFISYRYTRDLPTLAATSCQALPDFLKFIGKSYNSEILMLLSCYTSGVYVLNPRYHPLKEILYSNELTSRRVSVNEVNAKILCRALTVPIGTSCWSEKKMKVLITCA
jgi:hypothetical protein